MLKHNVCDGKYTVVFDDTPNNVQFYALRYGERWRDLIGDKLVLSMLQEIDELKGKLAETEVRLASAEFVAKKLGGVF